MLFIEIADDRSRDREASFGSAYPPLQRLSEIKVKACDRTAAKGFTGDSCSRRMLLAVREGRGDGRC